jgi:hypothetical protein
LSWENPIEKFAYHMFDEMSKWELCFVLLGSALLYSVVVNEVMVLSFLGIQNDVFWVADGDKSIFEAAC